MTTEIRSLTTGESIGNNATEPVGFHGATPSTQRAGAAQAAVVTTASATGQYGYTQAQADSIVALLNEIRAALVAKGLIKGSA